MERVVRIVLAAAVTAALVAAAVVLVVDRKDALLAAADCVTVHHVRDEQADFNAAAAGPRPVMAFLGDSYTAGVGAAAPDMSYGAVTASTMGMTPYLAGSSGSGFVAGGACGGDQYRTRVAAVAAVDPAVVVVQGSINDRTADRAALFDAMTTVLADVHQAVPQATVVAFEPLDPTPGGDPRFDQVRGALRDACTLTGTRCVTVEQGRLIGQLVDDDGIHPSAAGHRVIADRLAEVLRGSARLACPPGPTVRPCW